MTNLTYFQERTKDLTQDEVDLVAHCVVGTASICMNEEDFQRAVDRGINYLNLGKTCETKKN